MSDDVLEEIYAYLELDTITDQRLKLKANLMKKVVFYTMQWKEGTENTWIDKIATRTSVSTRKIREDYINPLVTEGILERTGDGHIRFVGLPVGAEKPLELTEQELQEELDEENDNRLKLGKPRVSLEEWKKMRTRRFKPLE
jgi:hypothetical protein